MPRLTRAALMLVAALCLGPLLRASAQTTASVDATITIIGAITLTPTPLDFGNHQIGTSSVKTITVTNRGASTFPVTVSATGSGEFNQSNDCGGSLAVGASCQVAVTFSPVGAGAAFASVTVSGSGHSYTDEISGTGTTLPPTATPVSIALNPAAAQAQDNAPGGSVVSVVTVTCSDGTTSCPYTLSTSNPFFQISGNNVVLAHGLSAADDGTHTTTITAQ